jgi:hypothetical protein
VKLAVPEEGSEIAPRKTKSVKLWEQHGDIQIGIVKLLVSHLIGNVMAEWMEMR